MVSWYERWIWPVHKSDVRGAEKKGPWKRSLGKKVKKGPGPWCLLFFSATILSRVP